MKLLLVAAAVAALASCAHHGDGHMKTKMMSSNSSFDLRGSFDMADANMDGQVSQAEFKGLYNAFDDNKDTKVNASEFISHFVKTGMSVQGSLYVFFRMDADGDNMITEAEVDMAFAKFDANMDGSASFEEYSAVMNAITQELREAGRIGGLLGAMVDTADVNSDGMLTGDELWSVVSPADTDGDGKVSEAEFKAYWMRKTGDSGSNAIFIFQRFDTDMDGFLGGDVDKAAVYAGFDYNKDGVVSKDEFMNGMLYIFAQAMKQRSAMMNKNKMLDPKKSFDMMDANKDGVVKMDEFEKAFLKMDANMDGDINATEFIEFEVKNSGLSLDNALFFFFSLDKNSDQVIDKMEREKTFKHTDYNRNMEISMEEYMRSSRMYMENFSKLDGGVMKLRAMVAAADVNQDGVLSGDEMWSIVSGADVDGKGINATKFVTFWTAKTGASMDGAMRLFKIFDGDMDGIFGSEAEKKGIYDSFDYNKDGMVSNEEFINSMIFIIAQIMREQHMDIKKSLWGTYNMTSSFIMSDINGDGMIQKAEFDAIYSSFDDDKNTEISIKEFVAHYMKAGWTLKGALYIFFRMDSNDDKKLVQTELDSAFASVDKNDDDMTSEDEYKGMMKSILHQLATAAFTGTKLEMMFAMADADMDESLTREEMLTIFAKADKDLDGLVSDSEFKTYWMMKTYEPSERTSLLFGYLDTNDDGFFGDGDEKKVLFDGFDYNDDNMVSKDEFMNGMLFLYARIISDLEMAAQVNTVIGYFF